MNQMATWMQSWTMDGKLAILLFPVVGALLLWSSLRMVRYSEVIIAKSRFGGGFIGATLIATVTSIPEMVTEITQGAAGHPENGMGDDIGSNAFSIFLIGVAGVFMFRYMFLNRLSKWTKMSIIISLGMTIVLSAFLLTIRLAHGHFGVDIPATVGLIPLGFFIFFLFTIFLTYKYDDGEEEGDQAHYVERYTLKQGIAWFCVAALFVAVFAVLLNVNVNAFSGNVEVKVSGADGHQYLATAANGNPSDIADAIKSGNITGQTLADYNHAMHIHKALGISTESAGGVFLAITTSLPEVVAFFLFLRRRQPAAAIASLVGSHFFNIGISFFGDLAYHGGATFNREELGEHAPLAIMTVCMLVLLVGHLLLSKKFPKAFERKSIYFIAPSLMIGGYILGWGMILAFG